MIAIIVAALVAMTVLTEQRRSLEERRPTGGPSISVIVPARNEASNLPRLLDDLAAQLHVSLDVLVVDDASTDATVTIARRKGVDVIEVSERPPGWNPKVWALTVGAEHATGDVLMFIDADVRLSPGAVSSVAVQVEQRGGLISVAPFHVTRRPVESLSAPWNVVTIAAGQNLAVGSLIAISRHDYDSIGGHAARPSTIIDDIELAQSAHRHGVPTVMLTGQHLVTVRSYPNGWLDIVDGWSKNTSAGAANTSPAASFAVTAWVIALLSPLVFAARGDAKRAIVAWIVTGWHLRSLTNRLGTFDQRMVSAGSPLLGVFFAAVTARSVWIRHRGRPARWKDRFMTPDGIEVT